MYDYEDSYYKQGYNLIAGCDEVGRGPLAGPLVAAAVILDRNHIIEGLNDSKKLSEKKRQVLYDEIVQHALAYSIVFIDEETIDEINVYQASKKGMIMAIEALDKKPDFILSDAMPLGQYKHEAIIKGDSKSATIAAASILAKVARDKYMIELDEVYPQYGFKAHKGYPTKQHIEALDTYGVLKIHRKSYKPIYQRLNKQEQFDL
jgi:ribonuclease HII